MCFDIVEFYVLYSAEIEEDIARSTNAQMYHLVSVLVLLLLSSFRKSGCFIKLKKRCCNLIKKQVPKFKSTQKN